MGGRILVVDDEPSVLEIFKRVLARQGHRVHTCLTPDEALGELTRANFDLLVVDKNLPGMNGFDLLASLREMDPDLPAILMTACPEPWLPKTVRLQGYLPKPFENLQQISDTVYRVLELSELWRGRRRVA